MSSGVEGLPVARLRAAVDALLARDLDVLDSGEITAMLVEVEMQKRRLQALDVALLDQLRDRRTAAEYCRTSDADLLVNLLRVTPAEAKARCSAAADLGVGRALTGEPLPTILPRVAGAVAAGQISAGHVAVIGSAIDRLPDEIAHEAGPVVEQFLVEAARHEHPKALERTAWLLHRRLDPDGAEPDVRRGKEFTVVAHGDGWSTPRGAFDPATTAAVTALLDALSAPQPAVDGTPDPRSAGERRHDALGEAAQRLLRSGDLPACGGVPATVVVTGTVRDWLAHTPTATPPAPGPDTANDTVGDAATETVSDAARAHAGGGIVRGSRGEVWRARDIRPCSDPFCDSEVVGIVITMFGQPLALGRTRRFATGPQRLVLGARDGGCAFPGCDRPAAWCEAHHILEWRHGGQTDITNLVLVCAFHHREFERRGWAVRMAADGLPEWIPPRHIDPVQKPIRNTAHHRPEITFARVPEP